MKFKNLYITTLMALFYMLNHSIAFADSTTMPFPDGSVMSNVCILIIVFVMFRLGFKGIQYVKSQTKQENTYDDSENS